MSGVKKKKQAKCILAEGSADGCSKRLISEKNKKLRILCIHVHTLVINQNMMYILFLHSENF